MQIDTRVLVYFDIKQISKPGGVVVHIGVDTGLPSLHV